MKSSSQHFPVALVHTEQWMGFSEDVYLMKPNNSRDKTVELAVTRLYDSHTDQDLGKAFVFVHDTYQNRNQWLQDHEDLIKTLLSMQADVWLVEMRGHGLSPKNRVYQDNTLNDFAGYDLPAVQRFVDELHPGMAVWVGAGEGALAIVRGIEAKRLKADLIASVHALDMERFHWRQRYWLPGWATIKLVVDQRQYFYRSGRDEPEFRGVWRQLVRERALFGRRRGLNSKRAVIGPKLNIQVALNYWLPNERLKAFASWQSRHNVQVLPYSDVALQEHLKTQASLV